SSSVSARGSGHDIKIRRHVGIERDRALVLIVRRVVEIDRVACLIDVEELPVRAGLERHARAASELLFAGHAAIGKIELPELVLANLLIKAERALAIGSKREADENLRSKRVEIDLLLNQIHTRDAHDAAVLHRVLDEEQPRGEAGILIDG